MCNDVTRFMALRPSDASCRYQQGRMPEALALLERALKLQPDSAEALSNYGITLRALNRWPEALEALDQAIKLRRSYPEAHSNRGGVLLDLDRADEALEAYNRALMFRRGFVDALLGRGLAQVDEVYIKSLLSQASNVRPPVLIGRFKSDLGIAIGDVVNRRGEQMPEHLVEEIDHVC